ncbi:MAG: hypothetical protein U5L72_19620 [Bacteroidales bacterium]|nr:hypothetical protein [Bacteroidales bacterium]
MKRTLIATTVFLIMSACLIAQDEISVRMNDKSQGSGLVIEKGQITVVIIDGKKYDSDILRLIDNNLIERVEVYKGEEAVKLYNETAVIVVTTKEKVKGKQEVIVRIKQPAEGTIDEPAILIDGRLAEPGEMEKISKDNIESISVLKDEASKKKYKSEAGVILIVTKKKDI